MALLFLAFAAFSSKTRRLLSRLERREDVFRIVYTSGPRAAAGALACGPGACVRRQSRVRREIFSRWASGQDLSAFFRCETAIAFADQVERAFDADRIDVNSYRVAVQNFPDRSAGQTFRSDMSDARAGGQAGESRVGQQRDVLSERQVFERARYLIGFFHSRAHRPDAGQHNNVPGLDPAVLDRGHRVFLADKNPR